MTPGDEKLRKRSCDIVPGRWRVLTRLRRRPCEIILEPDTEAQHIVVITAYPLGQ